ncbi:hypothetical protein HYR69_05840 [Candidatus Sumerlaeota bacterium]|nr:hypothetical protein [Candidatus Sumerlaeota bacterium]
MSKTAANDIVLPMVRALIPLAAAQKEFLISPLIVSSAEAWTLPYVKLGSTGVKAPDKFSPEALGWAIETSPASKSPKPKIRMAAFGTSELVKDSYITVNNTDALLMLNTVNWLTEQEDRVPVPERIIEGTPLMLGESQLRMILILITMAFPSAIFFGGIIYVRLTRRS